jgi:hypothetical protein
VLFDAVILEASFNIPNLALLQAQYFFANFVLNVNYKVVTI